LERALAAGPVLVHFFDFAQLNSVRTLPYLAAWWERYREAGLTLLGVHSPRFPFTRSAEAVSAALTRLGIEWPIALDPEMRIWRDYEPHGWPALFLWGRGGALRWYHLGEGEYLGTEEAIRDALSDVGSIRDWPPPVEPLRPSDAPDARVIAPSEEVFARLIGQWIARLGRIWTEGQITQLTRRPGSGTVFLTLRDPVADVSLQVTSSSAVIEGAGVPISEGQRVVVLARPEFYVPRGTLTLSAEQIQPVGLGELLARIEQLRRVLAAERLFDLARKRPLPFLPHLTQFRSFAPAS